MNAQRLALLALAGLALMASASAPKPHTFEKSATTTAGYDATWSAVIDVFGENNWPIENMEKDSGLITTDWMSIGSDSDAADCGGAGLASREDRQVRFNVIVRGDDYGATVTVNTRMRELRVFDHRESIADCTSTGLLEARVHALIRDAVLTARPPRRGHRTTASDRTAASAADEPVAGVAGGACYGNGTCNDGLACDEGRCTPTEP